MSPSRSSRLGRALAAFVALLAAACCALAPVSPGRVSAQADCQGVAIRSPFAGDVISGTIDILGSARIAGFQFYKLEWAPETEPESWRAVSSTIDRQVSNGRLDSWDSRALPDGIYRLKLTAVDDQANEVCRMLVAPLWLANAGPALPTPSPSPAPSPTALPGSIATETVGSEAIDASGDGAADVTGDETGEASAEASGDAEAADAPAADEARAESGPGASAADAQSPPVAGDPDGEATSTADDEASVTEAGPAAFVAAMAGAAARAFGGALLLALLIGGLFVARRRRP